MLMSVGLHRLYYYYYHIIITQYQNGAKTSVKFFKVTYDKNNKE